MSSMSTMNKNRKRRHDFAILSEANCDLPLNSTNESVMNDESRIQTSSKSEDSPQVSSSGGEMSSSNFSPKTVQKSSVSDADVDPESDDMGVKDDDFSVVHLSQEVSLMEPIEGAHTFLVDYDALMENKVVSYPEVYVDNYQPGQVLLPCSHKCALRMSLYGNPKKTKRKQSGQELSKTSALSHWEVVRAHLTQELNTVDDILTAMESYNPGFIGQCSSAFRSFFNSYLKCDEVKHFFSTLLPKLKGLALRLPSLVTQEIPLLTQKTNMSVTLSKKQIACLVANMFFNTIPDQDKSLPKYHNFFPLFCSKVTARQKSNFEKIKCLLNYFNRLLTREEEKFNDLQGVVSFHRRYLNEEERPKWESLDLPLTSCLVKASGLIEKENGALQVDFADRFVGGRVLGDGCVQEEIRFAIHPELYVSLLFTPQLLENECLIVQGAERYCVYSGYGSNFKFTKDHVDVNPVDAIGRKLVTVVAIDAFQFRRRVPKQHQYQVPYLLRELHKAYIGFRPTLNSPQKDGRPTAVATGNWGCGIFGGNKTLKFIIQWMAASCAGRDLLYLTFYDEKLASDLNKVKNMFLKKHYTVKNVWQLLCEYNMSKGKQTLLDYIMSLLSFE